MTVKNIVQFPVYKIRLTIRLLCTNYTYLLFVCSMLNALQERREERKKRACQDDKKEKQEVDAWQNFWKAESRGLLLYSCSHGTVDIVNYFITKGVSPITK